MPQLRPGSAPRVMLRLVRDGELVPHGVKRGRAGTLEQPGMQGVHWPLHAQLLSLQPSLCLSRFPLRPLGCPSPWPRDGELVPHGVRFGLGALEKPGLQGVYWALSLLFPFDGPLLLGSLGLALLLLCPPFCALRPGPVPLSLSLAGSSLRCARVGSLAGSCASSPCVHVSRPPSRSRSRSSYFISRN